MEGQVFARAESGEQMDGCWLSIDESTSGALSHQSQRDLFAYWQSKRHDGRLPARQDIDPLDFPQLLPTIALIDVVRGPRGLRFQYRLFGTALVDYAGRDLTGQWFDEIYDPAQVGDDLEIYEQVVESRKGYTSWRRFPMPDRTFIRYSRLILPLAMDGTTVDKLLLFLVFEEAEGETA